MEIIYKADESDLYFENNEWIHRARESNESGLISSCIYKENGFWQDIFASLQEILWDGLFRNDRVYDSEYERFRVKKKGMLIREKDYAVLIKGDFKGLNRELGRRRGGDCTTWTSIEGSDYGYCGRPQLLPQDMQAKNTLESMSISSIHLRGTDYDWSSPFPSLDGGKLQFKSINNLNLYELVGNNYESPFSDYISSEECNYQTQWLVNILDKTTSYEGPKFDTTLPLTQNGEHLPWYKRSGKRIYTDNDNPNGSEPNEDLEAFFHFSFKDTYMWKKTFGPESQIELFRLNGFGSRGFIIQSDERSLAQTIEIDNPRRTSFDRVSIHLDDYFGKSEPIDVIINEHPNQKRTGDYFLDQTIYQSMDEAYMSGVTWDYIEMPVYTNVDLTIIDHGLLKDPHYVNIRFMRPDMHALTFDTSKISDTAIFWSTVEECEDCHTKIYMHYDSPESPGLLRAIIEPLFDSTNISYEYINGSSNATFFVE